jgi:hypothetical protein
MALLLAAAWLALLAPAARAGEKSAAEERLERQLQEVETLLRQGLDRMSGAVETLLQTVPQYELPHLNDDGDIIIRRKRPAPAPETDEDSRAI